MKSKSQQTVVVGMSGGVDSSVAAYLLKEQGYRVIGLFMKNWDEQAEGADCPAAKDFEDVARVCEKLDIPYYSVEFVREYWDRVFSEFLDGYKKGITPNPDVLCNREIKFNAFFEKAMQFGADWIATGHYCRVKHGADGAQLLRGRDDNKDQSYFLHAVTKAALDKTLFPVGELEKSEVRRIAEEQGFVTHDKKDSVGICFIGQKDFRTFLGQYLKDRPGVFKHLETGEVLGPHRGTHLYTLGQRKGLGLGGQGDRYYVVDKSMDLNEVYVVRGGEHPSIYADESIAVEPNWVAGVAPKFSAGGITVKSRYRQADQWAAIEWTDDDKLRISYASPQRALTPGQYVVFYDGDVCLGGASIETVGETYYERGLSVPVETSTAHPSPPRRKDARRFV